MSAPNLLRASARWSQDLVQSDSTDLTSKCIGLVSCADFTGKYTDGAGNDVSNFPFQKGYNPVEIRRVWSTGTTLAGATVKLLMA